MKRALDDADQPEVKKPKRDLADLKARLAATKAKIAAATAKLAPKAAPTGNDAAAAPAPVPAPAILQDTSQHAEALSKPPQAPPAVANVLSSAAPPAVPPAGDKARGPKFADDPYFDPRMGKKGLGKRGQRKHALAFVDRDKAVQAAEAEKLKASKFGDEIAKGLREKERVQKELQAREAAAGGLDPNLVPLGERSAMPTSTKPQIPDIEWWDAAVLAQPNYEPGDDGTVALKMSKITELVEHPVPMEPPAEAPMPAPQPLKLTTREQKKMRRQKREMREKEKQRLIQEGLLEPAKPKVKLSNMHRVFGAEGVLNATEIELQIQQAAKERLAAHEDRNLAKKLTTTERKEKKIKKLFGEEAPDTLVQVFKVNSLTDGRHLYKIDINAKENRLTGACITTESSMNVVVVEGCAKSIRRFNHLMLNRIDWNPAQGVDEDDEDMFGELNKCYVVWEGSVQQPAFSGFVREKCSSEHTARQVLGRAGVAHYWDAAKSFQVATDV